MSKNAAIYHFTNESNIRPIVYKTELARLEEYARSKGYTVKEIFCDKSLKKCEQTEYERFLSRADEFDALFTKDFYHISKNTGKFMDSLYELRNKMIRVYSIENGYFYFDLPPFDEPRRVASYTCSIGSDTEMKEIIPVKNDIFKIFINKETQWTLLDQYFDRCRHMVDGDQIHLEELINNKDKYDLLIVHNLNDIHYRTSKFCKIREQLKLDIYSLQEGFLRYRKER